MAGQVPKRLITRYVVLVALAGVGLATYALATGFGEEREVTGASVEHGALESALMMRAAFADLEEPPEVPTTPPVPPEEAERVDTVAPDAVGSEAEEIDFEPVQSALPNIRVEDADGDVLESVRSVEGVRYATAVTIDELRLEAPDGEASVRVAAVDPAEFRALTPQITADAVDVWKRVAEGDAAFTHDTGHRLELELGERFPAGADGSEVRLRVGAYASNGVPPIADAVVSVEAGQELGIEGDTEILVAVDQGSDVATVAEAVESVAGVTVALLQEPELPRAFLTGTDATVLFEPFSYVSYGDGMIEIDPAWVRRNIVREEVPILRGEVVCHRLLIPQLRGALQEIEDRGLAHLIDPSEYGGCWAPRHILFNPQRALSMHAWGLAIDLNVAGNEYGNRDPEMDPRVVEVFDRWGFVWGGRWSTPDGMHFELGAVLEEQDGD